MIFLLSNSILQFNFHESMPSKLHVVKIESSFLHRTVLITKKERIQFEGGYLRIQLPVCCNVWSKATGVSKLGHLRTVNEHVNLKFIHF